MKSAPLTLALVAALSTGALPALAQSSPYDQYNREVDTYNSRQADYQNQQADYQARRDAYEAQRVKYEADKRAYDARWGYGAYERRYGAFRDYDSWAATTYRDAAPYADDRGTYRGYNSSYYDAYRSSPCERRRSGNATAGTVIGALAGAAIGSNVAARNARTEGAILGAVVGGAIGNNVGKSTARCDANGYYYSYNQTYAYNAGRDYNGGWDSDRYRQSRCRLAMAPVDWDGRTEYRYVRVCPDRNGRYRITR